ncbi:MAG: Ig-like domain-containing protein [Desulfitobacteriaceae bacterium]
MSGRKLHWMNVRVLVLMVVVLGWTSSARITLADTDKNFTVQDVYPGTSPDTDPIPGKAYTGFVNNGFIGNNHHVNMLFDIYVFITNYSQTHQEWVSNQATPVTVTLNGPHSSQAFNLTIPANHTYGTLKITCPEAGLWSISLSGTMGGNLVQTVPWYFSVDSAYNTALSVLPASANVPVGGTQQFTAYWVVTLFNQTFALDWTQWVSWSSGNPQIASIGSYSSPPSSPGLLIGVSSGITTVRAAFLGLSGSATVTVGNPVSLTITPSSTTVPIHGTKPLSAQWVFADKSTFDVTNQAVWESTTPGVATVGTISTGNPGLVTGIAPGTSTVTANAYGFTGSAKITVPQPSLVITPPSTRINIGESFLYKALYSDGVNPQVDVTSFSTWSSGDSFSAPVTLGLVTGLKSTNAIVITATYNNLSAQASVAVVLPTLSLQPMQAQINTQSTLPYKALYSDAYTSSQDVTGVATWSSTNTNVASVSSGGLASGVGAGTVKIGCAYKNAYSEADLTVVQPVLTITGSLSSIPFASTEQLAAYYSDANVTNQNVTGTAAWSSTNLAIATVDNSGVVKGMAAGTVTINAKYNGLNGSFQLTVEPPVVPPTLPPDWRPNWRIEVLD